MAVVHKQLKTMEKSEDWPDLIVAMKNININLNLHPLTKFTSSGGTAIVVKTLVSEEKHKSKGAGLWVWQSGIRVGKLTT